MSLLMGKALLFNDFIRSFNFTKQAKALAIALVSYGFFLLFWVPESPPSSSSGLQHRIDRLCSRDNSQCFDIVDQLFPANELFVLSCSRNRFRVPEEHVARLLTVVGAENFVESSNVLQKPPDADFSDSQFWPVNRKVLSTQHTAVMVAAPFIVQPELDLAMRAESLMIGLGGGTIDMFVWHHKSSFNMTVVELDETIVQVARKWYGTVDDERRHTVIGDGIEFMSNSSATGRRFKVIWLDAGSEDDVHFASPSQAFRSRAVVRLIRDILDSNGERDSIRKLFTGALIINTLVIGHAAFYELRKALLTEYFDVCFKFHLPLFDNRIIVCQLGPKTAGIEEDFQRQIEARIPTTASTLGLVSHLNGVTVKILQKK